MLVDFDPLYIVRYTCDVLSLHGYIYMLNFIARQHSTIIKSGIWPLSARHEMVLYLTVLTELITIR